MSLAMSDSPSGPVISCPTWLAQRFSSLPRVGEPVLVCKLNRLGNSCSGPDAPNVPGAVVVLASKAVVGQCGICEREAVAVWQRASWIDGQYQPHPLRQQLALRVRLVLVPTTPRHRPSEDQVRRRHRGTQLGQWCLQSFCRRNDPLLRRLPIMRHS